MPQEHEIRTVTTLKSKRAEIERVKGYKGSLESAALCRAALRPAHRRGRRLTHVNAGVTERPNGSCARTQRVQVLHVMEGTQREGPGFEYLLLQKQTRAKGCGSG